MIPGRRTIAAALVSIALVVSGCSRPAATTTTTTTTVAAITTVATTTTSTTTSTTTTTTVPAARVTVAIPGDESAAAAIAAMFTWIADRTAPPPAVPSGLAEAVAGAHIATDLDLTGEIHTADVAGGRVAVVALEDDIVLLADEGAGWEIVGAHLAGLGLPAWYGPPVRHVLIVGTDARPGQTQDRYRADSLHIVSSNLPAAGGAIVGIPRDTLVTTSYGQDKLTHVNAVSDRHTEELVEIVTTITGMPVEGYVLTGFIGFRHLVNGIGGVVLEVPYAMADEKSKAFLAKGSQRLWGPNALAFSRNRHIPGGDFTRSFHQGIVIAAAHGAVHQLAMTDLPALIALLTTHADTDLSPGDLLTLAATALDVGPDRVVNVVLAGRAVTVDGASVVILDDAANAPLLTDLADGVIDAG